jgi:hypothetical protein
MSWRRLRGVRPPIERLDPHALHQRSDVKTPRNMALALDEPLQHAAAGEGIFQMQLVDPAHQGQIGSRNRAGQIIDAAPTDAEHMGLPAD